MTVAVDDVLKVVWQAKVSGIGTRIQNVFYWQVNPLGDGDETLISDEFDGFMPTLYAFISDWLSVDYSLEFLRITNDTQKTFVGQPSPVFVGGGGANLSTPAQVAVEVLARAAILGHVARKYIGPCIEATHTDGVLVAAAQADFDAFALNWALAFVGGVTANGYLPVMVSHVAGGGIGVITPIDEDLHTVIPTARTQRRRIPGRGLS